MWSASLLLCSAKGVCFALGEQRSENLCSRAPKQRRWLSADFSAMLIFTMFVEVMSSGQTSICSCFIKKFLICDSSPKYHDSVVKPITIPVARIKSMPAACSLLSALGFLWAWWEFGDFQVHYLHHKDEYYQFPYHRWYSRWFEPNCCLDAIFSLGSSIWREVVALVALAFGVKWSRWCRWRLAWSGPVGGVGVWREVVALVALVFGVVTHGASRCFHLLRKLIWIIFVSRSIRVNVSTLFNINIFLVL